MGRCTFDRARAWGVAFGGFWFSVGTTARADPPGPRAAPVHVLAVHADDDGDDQAEGLTAALRNHVRLLPGYSLGEGDFALEVLTLGLKCAPSPDDACQTKIGDRIRSDRFIWGTLRSSKELHQVTAELHLWSRGGIPSSLEVTYSDGLTAPNDEALKALARDALAKLLPSARDRDRGPSLPSPQATSPSSSIGAAGTSARGAEGLLAGQPESPVREPTQNIVGWAGVGLGALLIAGGFYSVIRAHELDTDEGVNRYRQGFRHGDDACDKARSGTPSSAPGAATPAQVADLCGSAATFSLLQYVFFGLGAVSTGAGVYLLTTDQSGAAPTSRVAVAPAVGPTGGSLRLRVSF